MNALQTYVGRHRTRSSVDLAIPRIRVENIAAHMHRSGTMFVSLVDADTHNMLGLTLGPDAVAALRDALGSGAPLDGFTVRKYGAGLSACICGPSMRSVQCVVHGASS